MRFNQQVFLTEMREELRQDLATFRQEAKDDHDRLEIKVDKALETLHDHATRIVVVENTRKTIKWLGATFSAALIVGLLDLLFIHFKP